MNGPFFLPVEFIGMQHDALGSAKVASGVGLTVKTRKRNAAYPRRLLTSRPPPSSRKLAQEWHSTAGMTVTRSLAIRTSQSRWQSGQRNQARCIDTTSASGPPRRREGSKLPVQPQFSCGQATG